MGIARISRPLPSRLPVRLVAADEDLRPSRLMRTLQLLRLLRLLAGEPPHLVDLYV